MSNPSGGSGSSPQSTGGELQEAYRRRLFLFTALVAVVAAAGLWMAYTTIEETGPGVQLTITTPGVEPQPGEVTLLVRMLPKGRPELGRKLVRSPTIQDLAGDHRPFLAHTPVGKQALCVGLFQSADSGELEKLQHRFRSFTVDDKAVFQRARPRRIGQ